MRSYNVTSPVVIRPATKEDAPDILQIYKNVAHAYPTHITHQLDELSLPMVKSVIEQANLRGLARVLEKESKVIAFLKAHTSEYCRQAHILANGTLIVDPTMADKGYGSKLFMACVNEVIESFPHILIMETLAHHSNAGALNLYKKLGNVFQAQLPSRVLHSDGRLDDYVVFYRKNPNFNQQSLFRYHQYLKTLQQQKYQSS